MNIIKHSKYKNTGILFELLVRQITSDTLNSNESPIKEILKKYFVKTELGKEYKLYESLIKKISLSEGKADIVIDSLVESSKNLNRGIIKKQKYNLIKEIKEHYDLNKFFNHKLPHYKVYAAFYTILESYNTNQLNPDQLINNKITILEYLTSSPIDTAGVRNKMLEEFKGLDKDVRLLSYKISLDKFNDKYKDLNHKQKLTLKEYINSVDNLPKLKEFYIESINDIKNTLSELNESTSDEIVKIKINEVNSLIQYPDKNHKINDNDLIDLLQYYELIHELEKANG